MKITRHIHQRICLKNWLITLIILSTIICIAWVSRVYNTQLDVTTNSNNTLSAASQKILASLPREIKITAYIKDISYRKQVSQLLKQYIRFKNNIEFRFIDPSLDPVKTRDLNIGPQGAVIIEYLGRTKKLQFVDESTLSNALLQLASTNEHWITFLQGHGERSPIGRANFDLGLFGKQLEQQKFKIQTFNLAQFPSFPDNSSLLVLSTPRTALLPQELDIISDYIDQGGNLLLLSDPDNQYLISIEQQLGINKLEGTIVDASTGLYGIDDPSFVLVSEYPPHPITTNFNSITVFPVTAALDLDQESHFKTETLLSSVESSWTETGEITGHIRFDPDSDEQQGPHTIAYALTRDFSDKKQQRIVVLGDGDFLSNTFLGNVGNSEFGFRVINWLTHDDQFIEIPVKITADKSLQLSSTAITIIAFGFLIVLPLFLILTGFFIWRNRKRR